MVSVSPPMSSGSAQQYHSKEDYYTKSGGEWFGTAVEKLGLEQGSAIDKGDFKNLTEGKDLAGNQIIGFGGEQSIHRAGTDMTFSASKSVSVLALSDSRVIDAHTAAVKSAISMYDENFGQVRETVNGVTEKVQSQGSAWALFNHLTSRELEVQLHTHGFKMNAALDSKGEFRADSNENMYKQQMFMGAIYHSELAKNISELGYKITDIDRKNGTFEVAGINKDLTADMSSRRQQVLERAAELKEQFPNLPAAKINEMAALDSRQAKPADVSKEFLENKWDNMAAERGTTFENERKNAVEAGLTKEAKPLSAKDITMIAANSLLQNESTFSQKELLATAAKLAIGNHGIADISKAINQLYKSRELVNLNGKGGMDSNITTPGMKATEKNILNHIKDNAASQQPFYTPDIAKQVVDQKYTSLSDNQKEFVAGCLSSSAQVLLAQGFSGAGKTFAADKLVQEVKEHGFSVRAFGPTAAAARELGNSTGVKGETLSKFFMSDPAANMHDKGKELWVVDEASMISSKDMMQLISRAADAEARVLLIGDKNQLQSVAAGRIFSDLQKTGVTDTLQLTDIKRQTTEHMIDSAGKIRNIGQVSDVLKGIDSRGQLHEIKDFQERVAKISDDYISRDTSKTMLVVSTNAERHELNKEIHNKLHAEGRISEKEHTITMKENKSLGAVEKHFADSYQVGDLIQSGKSGGGLPSGYSGRITGIDTESNTFNIIDNKGNEKTFDPMQHADNISTYRERDITLSEGDKVAFLKNDEGEKGIGVVNGDTGTIKHIDENGYMTVEVTRGKETSEVSFNLGQYNNIDLAHAITSYKAQGASIDSVIVSGDPKQENYNDFYVAFTRGKEDATVYTPDKEALKDAIEIEQMKTSTLDYDKEALEMRNNMENIGREAPAPEMVTSLENTTLDKESLPEPEHIHVEKSDVSPVDYEKESAEMREHLDNEGGVVTSNTAELDNDLDSPVKEQEQEKEQDQERGIDL